MITIQEEVVVVQGEVAMEEEAEDMEEVVTVEVEVAMEEVVMEVRANQ